MRIRCFGFFLVVSLLFGGCANVRPWERSVLAKQAMDPNNRPEGVRDDFCNHAYDVREGASGGHGTAGGGCGCN